MPTHKFLNFGLSSNTHPTTRIISEFLPISHEAISQNPEVLTIIHPVQFQHYADFKEPMLQVPCIDEIARDNNKSRQMTQNVLSFGR
jgi:hypothetical protein